MSRSEERRRKLSRQAKRRYRCPFFDEGNFSGSDTWVVGDLAAWRAIASHFGLYEVNAAVSRVCHLRERIAADAGLPMPKIFFYPTGWMTETGMVYGRVNIHKIAEGHEWCVEIPVATPLMITDDDILRRILCHEFAHCFWFVTKAVTDGKSIPASIPDEDSLADPKNWFGGRDAESLLKWGDSSLHESTQRFADRWVRKDLPTEEGVTSMAGSYTIQFPDQIAARARKIIETRQQPEAGSRETKG